MSTIYKLLLTCLIIGFIFSSMALASMGALSGLIKEATTGEPIPKAKITVAGTKLAGLRYVLSSDKKGHFFKGGLAPDVYTVTVEKEGYIPMRISVQVRLDTVKIEAELRPFKGAVKGAAPTTSKLSTEASSLLDEGKFEEAIEKFTEIIQEKPENPVFYYYRGAAYEKTGQLEKTLQDYQKSVELKPDFTLPLSSLGKIYAKQKDFEKAIEFYRKAIEAGDQDVITFYNYGGCLMNVGNQAEAKEVFEKLISLDANYSDAYYQLGIIYIGLGNSAEAKDLLLKFTEMDPENPNVQIAKEILKILD